MLIRVGYEIGIRCNEPTPMTTYLNLESARHDRCSMRTWTQRQRQRLSWKHFADLFGNNCLRLVAPAGNLSLKYDAVVKDDGLPDPVDEDAEEVSRRQTCRRNAWPTFLPAAIARPTS